MTALGQLVPIVLCAALLATPGKSQAPPGWEELGACCPGVPVPPKSNTRPVPAPSGQPVEQPTDLNICGPLALAAAASYLGRPELYDPVFSLLPASGKPRTLNELQAVASELGLAARAVRWRPGRFLEFPCPAIVRLDPLSTAGVGHFVVVLRATGGTVQILDPPAPPSQVPEKKLWQVWDGIALHIATSESDPSRDEGAGSFLWVPALAVVCGLSTVLLLMIPGRLRRSAGVAPADVNEPEGRRRRNARWVLLLSALAPGVLLSPTLLKWGAQRASAIERAGIEGLPPFRSIAVDTRAMKKQGKKRASVHYVLRNRTTRAAVIAKVSTSCGCASPRLPAHRIPAGGSVELTVDVEPLEKMVRAFTIDVLFSHPENYHVELSGSISELARNESGPDHFDNGSLVPDNSRTPPSAGAATEPSP
ncbi:MAG: cysteine peptidase family C39 domain-containing protein [Isosphaeraceae bacterium]